MWLFRPFVVLVCLLAAACGFEPLYGAEKNIAAAYSGVEIANIPDRDGQYLRNLMIDRLYAQGRPADAPYRLDFSPLERDSFNIGIQKSASATRAQVRVSTDMRLVEKRTGKILLQRRLKAAGAYNLLDNQLATLASQQSTMDSLLRELGDSAATELNLYLRRQAAP